MADLEDKVRQEKEARANLSKYYGIYAAALRAQTEKSTGAMVCNGQPLLTSPYSPVTPVRAAAQALEAEVRANGNIELAEFMHQFGGVLGSKQGIEQYIESYEKGMKEKTLSEMIAMAASLGVNTAAYTNPQTSMYMDKTYEELEKQVKAFEEKEMALEKQGKQSDAQESLKYLQLSATLRNLRQGIDGAYDKKLQAQAEKMNGKNYGKLTAHENQDNLIQYIESSRALMAAKKSEEESAKAAGIED